MCLCLCFSQYVTISHFVTSSLLRNKPMSAITTLLLSIKIWSPSLCNFWYTVFILILTVKHSYLVLPTNCKCNGVWHNNLWIHPSFGLGHGLPIMAQIKTNQPELFNPYPFPFQDARTLLAGIITIIRWECREALKLAPINTTLEETSSTHDSVRSE